MKTLLFNPYNGLPRNPLDIQSDPQGILMLDPDEPLYAAKNAAPEQPKLTVWFGSMPESNGKKNWTVILRKKDGDDFLGSIADGVQFHRSEYHDRARYDADCLRFLIGEIDKAPFILDYDGEMKSPPETPMITSHAEEANERNLLQKSMENKWYRDLMQWLIVYLEVDCDMQSLAGHGEKMLAKVKREYGNTVTLWPDPKTLVIELAALINPPRKGK